MFTALVSDNEASTNVEAIGAGAGVGVALLLAVVVIVGVFLWRRRYAIDINNVLKLNILPIIL